MITDKKFEEARHFLHLDSVYPLLHEIKSDKIASIMKEGLNLDKSYNGEISRVIFLTNGL